MNQSKRTALKQLALGALALTMAGKGYGQSTRPLTIIVPFGPGGSSDLVARIISQRLSKALDRSVIIDNKPGATGAIGASMLTRAAPDGNTLMIASVGVFAINPALQQQLSYEPLKDFTLLTEAVRTPNVLVTHPRFPANDIQALLKLLKEKPRTISFATGGQGSSEHLNTELFWQRTNTQGIHVPYKGSGQAVADLLAGHADVGFLNLSAVTQYVKSGKLKAIAITSDKPSPLLPDVPTLAQAGLPDMSVYSWQGIALPRNAGADIAAGLHKALVQTLKDPEIEKNLVAQGFEVVASSQSDFQAFVAQEIDRWKTVAKTANVTLD